MKEFIESKEKETYFWSRRPGKHVDSTTGTTLPELDGTTLTVRGWYGQLVKLVETVQSSLKLKDETGFVVVNTDVATIVECHDDYVPDIQVSYNDRFNKDLADPMMPKHCIKIGVVNNNVNEKSFDVFVSVDVEQDQMIVGNLKSEKLGVIQVLDMKI